MASLTDKERQIRLRLRDDYAHYAPRCLSIRTKAGSIVQLEFNQAQQFIHERLEKQKRETGRVRALILKGRQQGCSTYVAGRYYHAVSHRTGCRVFILTHEDQATQNLFEMVDRYHSRCPELVRPSTGAANAKELYFDKLDSGYKIGTAGTKGVGRSSTVQLFHGSEVAFWPHAETHAAGIMQAVADAPGTEIILESTANGVGNFFYSEWQDAEAGKSDYLAIFVPWYWQDEYRKACPSDIAFDDEETAYGEAYGLDRDQLYWRRFKIRELKDPLLFKQEYPANSAEAFQVTGHDSFIKPEIVLKARKARIDGYGPLVLGYDPAWMGSAASALARRIGRHVPKVERRYKMTTMEQAGWLKSVIDAERPARLFIDVGGVGAGIYDRLVEMGPPYSLVTTPVNFGSKPFEPPSNPNIPGPGNRRAEMWMNSREWLEDPAGVDIPDENWLQGDACGPGYRYDSSSRIFLEKKEDMVKRDIPSPDGWDAVALTFAEPVAGSHNNPYAVSAGYRTRPNDDGPPSAWCA